MLDSGRYSEAETLKFLTCPKGMSGVLSGINSCEKRELGLVVVLPSVEKILWRSRGGSEGCLSLVASAGCNLKGDVRFSGVDGDFGVGEACFSSLASLANGEGDCVNTILTYLKTFGLDGEKRNGEFILVYMIYCGFISLLF